VWTPLLKELSLKTNCNFTLIGSKSINAFEEEIKNCKFDFAYVNPVQVWIGYEKQGYMPLARSSVKKVKGIIVVKKDNPIKNLKKLEGATLAFPSPRAIGATLLTQEHLKTLGVNFESKYVKTHSSVYFHVAKGLVKAGGGVKRTLNNQPDYVKNALHIIYTTDGIFPHAFVAHDRVPKNIVHNIQNEWFQIWNEKPDLLSGVPMESPEKPLIEDYKPLKKWILE